jgi:1,4-dihydroxy-2-naphthoyl-CoA hydrolase
MSSDSAAGGALEAEHDLLAASEFLMLLGIHLEEVTAIRVTGWFEVGPQHHQPYGLVHGGVHASVVETVASVGAVMAVRDSGRTAVGVANSTDFLRSTTSGRLEVVATAVYQGRSQQLWDVLITRAVDGKDVARGHVRLQNIDSR